MDDSEQMIMVAACVAAAVLAFRWYLFLFRLDALQRATGIWIAFLVAPPLCLLGLWCTLRNAGDPQVADVPGYLSLFIALGAVWLTAPVLVLASLGISFRDDAMERRNIAAAIVCVAAFAATTIVYACANIGTGPTIWTTLMPAALGTGVLVCSWIAHRLLSPAWEDTAVGRDAASGVRLGSFLIAAAFIIGAPLAGPWVSAAATCSDLWRSAWPVVLLVPCSAAVDRLLSPTMQRPRPGVGQTGLLIGLIWLIAAGLTAARLR